MFELAIFAILLALFFDFINGFHDAANSIATVIGTRVLKPLHAVSLAAAANFLGPFIFGVAVATIIGAGIAGVGTHAILFDGLTKVGMGIIISPVVGMIGAFLLGILLITIFAKRKPIQVNSIFGKLQLVSSTYFSLTHGANDGQKTMGIIALILLIEGVTTQFEIPFYVILISALAISLGTFFGGWRIVKTMAVKITQLKPYQGFAAETGGATVLAVLAWAGIPASTTHAISGAIMGAGSVRRMSAVRWGIGKRIVWAWIITIPASAAVGYAITILIKLIS